MIFCEFHPAESKKNNKSGSGFGSRSGRDFGEKGSSQGVSVYYDYYGYKQKLIEAFIKSF